MLIGYARVSTQDQSLEPQVQALTAAGCERIFTDTASGGRMDRTGIKDALSHLRAGDVLVVWKLDRLGRTTRGMLEFAGDLEAKKVGLKSLTDHIEIKQFTNIEVLKQNVEFQMEGAGDYSAMINKVKPEGDETYDSAFFRQFVAPELLRHAMGTEGDSDEDRFEDTILKTLKPAADALLDINRRQRELDDTQEALRQFEPVLEKATEVVSANADYEREMVTLARNAATVQSLVGSTPIPGIPVIPAGTQWASDKRVMAALGHMVIDKKHGSVITDEGLAALIGVETGRVNQYARDKRVETLTSDLQVIELKDVIKRIQGNSEPVSGTHEDSQHIEYKDVIKLQKHGGRRKAVLCYDFESALSLVSATSNLAGAKTSGLSDVLTRAFGIASNEIDTNPYRKIGRRH